MTIETMSTMEEALKYFYIDAIKYQLNDEVCKFLTQIERNSKDVAGISAVMPLKYGVSGGVATTSETGPLPTPSARQFKQAKWGLKDTYARLQISDKLMKASRNRKGSFVSQLDAQLEDLLTDAKLQLSRQTMGDGTGKLFTVINPGASASDTVPVDTTRNLMENMRIDFIVISTGNVEVKDCIITSIDRAAGTIKLNKSVTVGTTEMGVVNNSYDNELTGLAKVFDHTNFPTIYEIDRSLHKWFVTNKVDVNGEISEVKVQEGLDKVEIMAGSPANFIICSHGVRRAYLYFMSSQKRIVNKIEIKGGYKEPEFNGLPIVADRFMAHGIMYALNTNDFNLFQLGDWDWLSKDGAVLSRVKDTPAWEATLAKYADIGCNKMRGQVQFTRITEH